MTTESMTADPSAINLRGNLETVMSELERQKTTKLDFCADARTLQVQAVKGTDGASTAATLRLCSTTPQTGEFIPKDGFEINPGAMLQLGQRVSPEIPTRFLRALAGERPVICAELLSSLMIATGRRYFIRCLDSRVRAILSDRYRVLDNYDFVFTSLETIKENGGHIVECSLSDTNLRLSFSSTNLTAPRPNLKNGGPGPIRAKGPHRRGGHSFEVGHVLANGMVVGNIYPFFRLGNSETGHGGIAVEQGIFDPQCENGFVIEKIIGRVHLGEKLDAGVFSEETQAADSRAIMLKARDAIRASLTESTFRKMIDTATEAQADTISAPSSAVNNVLTNAGLPDSLRDSLLSHFIKDYDQTRYGLAGAVSRLAQDQTSADDCAALETLAGSLVKSNSLLTVA